MKNSFFLILLSLLAIINLPLIAQNTFFSLKDYKTTNYERSSLGLIFNLDQDASSSDVKNENQFLETSKSHSLTANLAFNSSYSKILYTEKKVVEYGAILGLLDRYNDDYDEKKDSVFSFSHRKYFYGNDNINAFYNQDFYYSVFKQNYFKVGGRSSFEMINGKGQFQYLKDSLHSKYSYSELSSVFSIDLGQGHGRIENVEDAVEAMYILTDLSKNNFLIRSYEKDDIEKLADKITLIKKERFFDDRLYKQKSMKALIDLLIERNLIKHESIEVFNIIADYHYFAGIETRPSGEKLEYYITPGFLVKKNYGTDHTIWSYTSGNIGINASYSTYKPISLKWQQNIYCSLNALKTNTIVSRLNNLKPEINGHSVELHYTGTANVGFNLGYYPNTRSSYIIGVNSQYVYHYMENVDSKTTEIPNFWTSFNMRAYYYLSEKLRLSGEFEAHSSFNDLTKRDMFSSMYNSKRYFQQKLDFTLSYFIF